jgi:membrane-associated phospholipid phosphatase
MRGPTKRQLSIYTLTISALAVFLASFSFLYFDQAVSLYFSHIELTTVRNIAKVLTDVALGENFFILCAFVFLMSHWIVVEKRLHPYSGLKKLFKWVKTWSLNFFVALLFSGAVLHLFKFLIGRARPHMTETYDTAVFDFFTTNWSYQSMPSGHAQVMGCVATMFAVLWPKAKWMIYPVAALFAFTRVVVHAHFLSDVILGLALGHLATLWCLWLLESRYPKRFSLK